MKNIIKFILYVVILTYSFSIHGQGPYVSQAPHKVYNPYCDELNIEIEVPSSQIINTSCEDCTFGSQVHINGLIPEKTKISYSGTGYFNDDDIIVSSPNFTIPCPESVVVYPRKIKYCIKVEAPHNCNFEKCFNVTYIDNESGYAETDPHSYFEYEVDESCLQDPINQSYKGVEVCCNDTDTPVTIENISFKVGFKAGLPNWAKKIAGALGFDFSITKNLSRKLTVHPPCDGCNYLCIKKRYKIKRITFYTPIGCSGEFESITRDYKTPLLAEYSVVGEIFNKPNPDIVCEGQSYTDWEFDPTSGNCIRYKHCNGKRLPNTTESEPAQTYDEYDSETSECITLYYCKSDLENPAFTKRIAAVWSPWAIDDTNKDNLVCYTELTCNGISVPDAERVEMDAEIRWEFDDSGFEDKCIGKVFCDGSQTGYTLEKDVEIETDWYYDDFDEKCKRVISCDGSDIEQEKDVEIKTDWYYDDWDEKCKRVISCDGSDIDEEMDVEIEVDYSSCIITYICGDNEEEVDGDRTIGDELYFDDEGKYCYRKVFCEGEETDEEETDVWALGREAANSSDCDDECLGTKSCFEYTCDGSGTGVFFCDYLFNVSLAQVSPNPFTSILNISIFLQSPVNNLRIEMVNSNGSLVTDEVFSLESGQHDISINIDQNLISGLYFIRAVASNTIIYEQTLVKN